MFPELDTRQGLIDEAEIEGGLCGVAVGLFDQPWKFVGVYLELLDGHAARGRDILEINPPQIAEPFEVCLLGLGRHVVSQIGLDIRFILADPEDMDIETEAVDAVLVVHLVPAESLQHNATHLVHQDLVGVRSQEVSILLVEVGRGDDLLPARFEINDRVSQVLELGHPPPTEGVQIQDQGLDTVIVLAGLDRVDDVLEEGFRRHGATRLVDRALDRLAGELLDELPLRGDDERGGIGDVGIVVAEQDHQEGDHQRYEEQVHERPPRGVDTAPGAAAEIFQFLHFLGHLHFLLCNASPRRLGRSVVSGFYGPTG